MHNEQSFFKSVKKIFIISNREIRHHMLIVNLIKFNHIVFHFNFPFLFQIESSLLSVYNIPQWRRKVKKNFFVNLHKNSGNLWKQCLIACFLEIFAKALKKRKIGPRRTCTGRPTLYSSSFQRYQEFPVQNPVLVQRQKLERLVVHNDEKSWQPMVRLPAYGISSLECQCLLVKFSKLHGNFYQITGRYRQLILFLYLVCGAHLITRLHANIPAVASTVYFVQNKVPLRLASPARLSVYVALYILFTSCQLFLGVDYSTP